jgi:flagellar hook protein FlgE
MFSGVSGLEAHQTALDVIGNNIANVNTIGFKAGSANFQDQLSQTLRASASPSTGAGGQNPSQVGLGVELGGINTDQTQGNLQSTGSPTDMAIQGNGFFMVSGDSSIFYTRDGSFSLDSDGVVVNPSSGLKLLGYQADTNGKIDTSEQISSSSVITIPVGTLTSVKQTSEATLEGNLDSSSALQSTKVTFSGDLDVSTPTGQMNTTVYDADGNAHSLQIALTNPVHNPAPGAGVPTGATQRWDVNLILDGSTMATQHIYAVPNGSGGNSYVFSDNASPGNSLGSSLVLNVAGSNGASNFPLTVDFSSLNAKSAVTTSSDGQTGVDPIQSTQVSLAGSLNLDGSVPIVNTQTIYSANGTAYTMRTTLSNPVYDPAAAANVPTGATQQWDMKVEVDTVPPSGYKTVYDSSVAGNQESKVYYVPDSGFITADENNPANSLSNTIQLVAGALPPGSANQGLQTVTNFPLTIDLSGLTTSKTATSADGQTGSPPEWGTSVTVYDSLGISHQVNFQFTRTLVGSGAPATAAARWEWTATENGNVIATSKSTGDSPLFFDNAGNLLNTNNQKVTVTPNGGASPFTVSMDVSTLTQLAGTSNVSITSQDGFPVGTLQTFSVADTGIITGVFSNGQTRTLGQIALANFSNPSGLEKDGQSLFSASSNSGLAQVGLPTTNGRGSISTGYLEMSNVDLSTEFTNLIVMQRGFEANSKIVSVVDQLLQDVINMKQA